RWSRSHTPSKQDCSLLRSRWSEIDPRRTCCTENSCPVAVSRKCQQPIRGRGFLKIRAARYTQSKGERAMRHRRYLTAAMTVAALVVNVPAATAQPQQQPQQQPTQPPQEASRIGSAIDEAVKGLDAIRRFKRLSPKKKKMLVEFVTGNTLFVLSHKIGHGVINEMDLPIVGHEEDAADSFAINMAIKMNTKMSERVLE